MDISSTPAAAQMSVTSTIVYSFSRSSQWLHGHQQHTSGSTHECAAAQSIGPWTVTRKALHECGGDTSSFPISYPTAACSEFPISCRIGRDLFTLPVCCRRCPWNRGLRPEKLHQTHSVAVIPSPSILYPMATCPEFHVGRELSTLPTY